MSKNWDIRNDKPLVSVCIVTYNQASYIRDSIDSVLNQKTDFPFEICIGEDDSNDGTREICKEYAEKYPDRIRLFLRSREDVIYCQGYPTGQFNMTETMKACRGKYVAICEGDDYWQNPEKLNKQVCFMETHPEYVMCHSDYDYQNQVDGYAINNFWESMHHRHELEEGIAPLILSEEYIIRFVTALMKKEHMLSVLDEYAEDFGKERFRMTDSPMFFHLARKGKIKYFPESMAVYRRVTGSATAMNSFVSRYSYIKNAYFFTTSFSERFDCADVRPIIERKYLNQLVSLAVLTDNRDDAKKYAEQLTAKAFWKTGSILLRLAALRGGVFSSLYKSSIKYLLLAQPRVGNLSGHLRVLMSNIRNK